MGRERPGTAIQPAISSDFGKGDRFAEIRRGLLRLVLDEDDPVQLRAKLDEELTRFLGRVCSFFDGDGVPDSIPGCLTKVSYSGHVPIGMVLLGPGGEDAPELNDEELQEIADIAALAAIVAGQNKELIELHSDSEDMLFHAPDAICVLSSEGIVLMANRRALEFTHKEPHEVEGGFLGEVLGGNLPAPYELQKKAKRGEKLEIDISGGPLGTRLASLTFSEVGEEEPKQILCVLRDITKERQAQLALRRNERSSLMGETVGYLLHEINNPLAALLSNAGLAEKRTEEFLQDLSAQRKVSLINKEIAASVMDDFVDRAVHKIEQAQTAVSRVRAAGVRMQNTMLTLRTLDKLNATAGPEEVDVGFELGLAIGAAQQESEGQTKIFRSIDSLPKIEAVPFEIAEAFAALIKNAVQAIQDRPDGKVLVSAQTVGTAIEVVVEDNGVGIPEELRDKIFMPFFTTKPLGLALGLGLTMAEDTIRKTRGSIALDRTYDDGARFVVRLPGSSFDSNAQY